MCHVAIINESSDMHQRIISYVSISHVTDTIQSYHLYVCVVLFVYIGVYTREEGANWVCTLSHTVHIYVHTQTRAHRLLMSVRKGGVNNLKEISAHIRKSNVM